MSRWSTATATGVSNVHERVTPGSVDAAWQLVSRMGVADDPLWPADRWPPLSLDRGIALGSVGGHGPVRYAVSELDAGQSVRFDLDPEEGIVGFHAFDLAPHGHDQVRWRHTLVIESPTTMVRHAIIPLHDALIEDLLDQAEAVMSGNPVTRAALGVRVRALRMLSDLLERAAVRSP